MEPSEGGRRYPKTHRLRKRHQYLETTRRGAKRYSASFIFFLRPNRLEHSRLGVTASKKVGNAPQRNRIKRLVREAFRQHPELFRRSLDIVVVAKRDVPIDNLASVVKEFRHVLRRYVAEGERSRPSQKRPRGANPDDDR